MNGAVRYLTPGTHVWFWRGHQKHAGTVESRQAGVYRVSTPTESYLVCREDVRERRSTYNPEKK